MSAIGYMPLLKKGATLFSAVVVHNRMFQAFSRKDSFDAMYGNDGRRRFLRVLEATTDETTKWLFGPTVSPREVLEQHTLFGAYSRVMAPHVATTLANQLIAGDGSKFRWAFRGHRARRVPPITTTQMRSCEKCIEEDHNLQGFASWRVLHLLPSIGHCPEHGVPLRDEGETRAAGFHGWPLRLPGEQRSNLSKVKAMNLHVSDGYAGYLQLWTETFEGNLIGIAPDMWMLVMDAVVRRFGTIAQAHEQLTITIQRLWDAKLADLAESLGIPDGADFVRAELEQRVQASYVASRLVITVALDALALSPPRQQSSPWHSPIERAPPAPFGTGLTPQTQSELSSLVINANFPPALFRTMAENIGLRRLSARLHLDYLGIRNFIKSLPDELLHLMSQEQSWDRSSWLIKELERREAVISLSKRR